MEVQETLVKVGLFFIPFLFSLCFHEFAHGFVAKIRGDNTAEMMGRLTMNPMAHLDWVGTVGLPIMFILFGVPFLFGWAKPVPVNPRNLKDVKNDMFWVALAGPLSNVLLFFVGLLMLYFFVHFVGFKSPKAPEVQMLVMFLSINLYLAFFNMLPLHPLDGGKVFERFLPYEWNRWLYTHQHELNIALLVLILVGGLHYMAIPVNYIIHASISFVLGGVT